MGPTYTVREVCAALEEMAPPGLCYSWDRAGLAVGNPADRVQGVVVALSLTPAAVAEVRGGGATLLVTHHPAIWEPLTALRSDIPETRLLLELAAAGVSCYSLHTNFDLIPSGTNRLLANALSLREIAPLLPASHAALVKLVTFVPESHLAQVRDAVCAAGAGRIGAYTHCTFSAAGVGTFLPGAGANPFVGRNDVVNDEPELRFETLAPRAILDRIVDALKQAHPYEEVAYDVIPLDQCDSAIGMGVAGVLPDALPLDAFARHVRKALGVDHVRVTGAPNQPVRCVGVIGGAGGSDARLVAGKVDVLVTGDVGYHDALAASMNDLAVIDAGHDGTERCVVGAIAAFLKSCFPEQPVREFLEPNLLRAITE